MFQFGTLECLRCVLLNLQQQGLCAILSTTNSRHIWVKTWLGGSKMTFESLYFNNNNFFVVLNNYQTINPIIMDPMFLIININKPTYECAKHVIGQKIHEKYKF